MSFLLPRARALAASCLALSLLWAAPFAAAQEDAPAAVRKRPALRPHSLPAPPPYGQRDDVMRFADEVAERNPDLDVAWVREQLSQAR